MRIASWAVLVLIAIAMNSYAEPQRYVSPAKQVQLIELYTSEGCSSCPPADKWLSDLSGEAGLWQQFVPVALHVDYWDYIGWRDPYAAPFFSLRQQRHAQVGDISQVYTPGFVVDGREWQGWFRERMRPQSSDATPGVLSVDLIDGVRTRIQFQPQVLAPDKLSVSLAVLGFDLESAVANGENAGRTLHHDFVVLGMVEVPLLRDKQGYQAEVSLPPLSQPAKRTALAAWVSAADSPMPLQAVGGWLPATP
jgi:hypothetical protein